MQKKFKIEVDCANCAAKIETAIKALPGVKNASVSFMAQKLLLEADDANEKRQTNVMNELDEKIARGDAGLKIAEERAARLRWRGWWPKNNAPPMWSTRQTSL